MNQVSAKPGKIPPSARRASHPARQNANVRPIVSLPKLNLQVLGWMAGIVLLTPALFMSQAFWGPEASFPLMSMLGVRGGVAAIALMGFCEALVAALPFGILFGCLHQSLNLRRSVLFSLIPAALIFAFAAWAGYLAAPLWWTSVTDVLLFVLLFCFFSLVGSTIRRAVPTMHYAYPAVAFLVLAISYTIGPHLYLRYAYENPV